MAIPSGVYRYWREGRMVWPLTWIVVAGTLPGVLLGAIVRVKCLPDPKQFKMFAAGVLLYIGIRMFLDLTRKMSGISGKLQSEKRIQEMMKRQRAGLDGPTVRKDRQASFTRFNFWRFGYTFYGEEFDVSTIGVFFLSLIVGGVGGIYGIGGGAIIAPFFVTFFGLPVYTVAGATLMGTFVTSVAGVAFYQMLAPFHPNMDIAPDWLLGLLFGLGGMAGMYLGARCQKHVPARAIKWMLVGIIVSTAMKYIFDILR